MKANDFQNNLWTLLSSGISAIFVSVMVFVTVRTIGLAEAGMLSFAAAVGGISQLLVMFSVRPIQSTDINQEYSLNSYLGLRVFSALFASAVVVVFLIISGFELNRIIVIFLVYMIYFIDGFFDLFMGDLQQKGKMRIAGRMRVCAFGICMVVFTVFAVLTKTIIIPLCISCASIFIVYIIWIWFYRRQFKQVRINFDKTIIKKLTIAVLPLLIGTFIYSFLFNSQKYYLNFLVSDESVAIISILILPTSFLSILCSSLFMGAEMTKTAKMFINGQLKQMSRRVNYQFLFAVIISAVFVLCSLTFGIPLLSWVFNNDLSMYQQEFLIITLGGVSFVFLAVLGGVMITMRLQKINLYNIITIAIIAGPISWFLVLQYGILGAAYTSMIIFIPFAVSSFIVYKVSLNRMIK